MNPTEAAFLADNPLFGGLANYLDKKDLLQDFADKIANLEIMKRVRLEEYFQVFEELKVVRGKRMTLMCLYLKIARCVYYSACLHRRLQELYFAVTPDFFRRHEAPGQTHQVFRALHYLLTGEEADWETIETSLKSEELIPRLTAMKVGELADERSAYLKENYLQDPQFKANISVLPAAFSFVRVLSEWMIAQVLFKDYPDQMKEIDELILKVNEERSNLENDETQLRNQILEIASHIDSLRLRLLQLQEDVQLAVREENARDSITGHLRNDFEGDYDISEILTGQMGQEDSPPLRLPITIEMATGTVPEKLTLQRKDSGSVNDKLPTTFKLDTIASRPMGEDSPTFRSISQGSRKKPSRLNPAKHRHSNDSVNFNQKLHDELEQMKKALLDDYNRKKPQQDEVGSGNMDDYYLRFIAGGGDARPDPDEPTTPRKVSNKNPSFLPDFEKIDVLSVSDNLSVNKPPKSPDDSQILGKNFLLETGFSKFDALIKKGATANLTGTAMGSKNTIMMTPQTSNNQNFNDFSVLMTSGIEKKTVVLSDNAAAANDVLRKINDKLNMDAYFLERLDKQTPLGTPRVSQQDIQKTVTASAMTYGRTSSSPTSDLQSDLAFTAEAKESLRAKFTSFKGPSPGEAEHEFQADIRLRNSDRSLLPNADTPRLPGADEPTEFPGITADNISHALDKHRMQKKKNLDLSGIIDGYLEWKFEEFRGQTFRFPELPFFQTLTRPPAPLVSVKEDNAVSQFTFASVKKTDRSFFGFKVIAVAPVRPHVAPLPGIGSMPHRRDPSPNQLQSSLNESIRYSNQTNTRTSPESFINQSILTKSIWETPHSKPVSFKQLAGNQKLPSVIFQNAVYKPDRNLRGSTNSSEGLLKTSNQHSPFGSGIKFVNAPIISFHKSPQTPNIKSTGNYLTPTVKGQPVGELWPKIFDHPGTPQVQHPPHNVLRNSFNEIVLDGPEVGPPKDVSPVKTQIRDSRSTAAGNSRSMGDRSPATMIVNGREAWLVKTDKEGALYRYK